MAKTLMAVDAGTGSVRAVLFSLEGEQLGCVQQEWTHREDPRYPGSMDFDWVHNWDLARGCIRGVIEQTGVDPHDIAAVSTTCMREGIVLYDKDGQEIWACANVDARSDDEVAQLVHMNPELEKQIYRESGQTYALGALPRLFWVKNKMPEVYEKTAMCTMFNDWLIYKMTGVFSSEPSNACTTGIFDLKARDWDDQIAASIGLKTGIFPKISECGTVVAQVGAKGAAETGLAEGTPVVAGGGDAQLGCVGVGVVDANQAAIFGGSFWQYEYNTDEAKTDEHCRVRVNCHSVPGIWQYEALAFKPGMVMRWYRDAFCQYEKELSKTTGRDPYDLMNEKAKDIPAGCYGMMCAFSDVMNYISWRRLRPGQVQPLYLLSRHHGKHRDGHLRPHAARPRIHRQHSQGGRVRQRRVQERALVPDSLRRAGYSGECAERQGGDGAGRGHHGRPRRGPVSGYLRDREKARAHRAPL